MTRRPPAWLTPVVTAAAMAGWCPWASAAGTAQPGAAETEQLCRPTVPLSGYAPVASLRGAESYGSDRAAEPFVLAVMEGAAAWHGLADRPSARATIAEMRRWAEAGALEQVVEVGSGQSNTNSVYSLRRALTGLLASWAVLGPAAETGADRRTIEDWLARLVAVQDTDTGRRASRGSAQAVSNRNNHAYLRGGVEALWAVHTGDRALAARALATAREALDDMRADGSLPLETARGARALWYKRNAIASLVLIGEVLAPMGFDIWGARPDGRSLHDAVGFLVAASGDPALVAGYAAANRSPEPGTTPDRQDLGFLVPRGNHRHYMAWAEYYLRRFPKHPNAAPLAALVRPSLSAARPMIDEIVGGKASCLVLPRAG
ncbi:MAG TPA: alginate lyase family protein [Acetobacteraceae bacterium]|jgi:poly(beta-D-mannuronate) lyase|nr:alginate lyase family protein [Acetobacteraceae bacterium]